MVGTIKNTTPQELQEIYQKVISFTQNSGKKVFLSFDTETTGFNNAYITSVGGAFVTEDGEILKDEKGNEISFEFFLNPLKDEKVNEDYEKGQAKYITLITKGFLEGTEPLIGTEQYISTPALDFKDYEQIMKKFITTNEIIPSAHNSEFDRKMLNMEYARLGQMEESYKTRYLDTRELSKNLSSTMGSKEKKEIKDYQASLNKEQEQKWVSFLTQNNLEAKTFEEVKKVMAVRTASPEEKQQKWEKLVKQLSETHDKKMVDKILVELMASMAGKTANTLDVMLGYLSILEPKKEQRSRQIGGVEAHGAQIDSLILADVISSVLQDSRTNKLLSKEVQTNIIKEVNEVDTIYFQTDTSMVQKLHKSDKKEIIQLASFSVEDVFEIAKELKLEQIVMVNSNTLDYARISKKSKEEGVEVVYGGVILVGENKEEKTFLPKSKKAAIYIQKNLMKELVTQEEYNDLMSNIPEDILNDLQIEDNPTILKTKESQVPLLKSHNKNPVGEEYQNQEGLYTQNTNVKNKKVQNLQTGYPDRVERMPEYTSDENKFIQEVLAMANNEEERQRLQTEIEVLDKTGFIKYFEIQKEFIDFTKEPIAVTKDGVEQKIQVGPGRGSGAGSLIAYKLGITSVNPLPLNLFFERFLNLERVSAPDFDIDYHGIFEIEDLKDEELKQYLKETLEKNVRRVDGRTVMVAHTTLKYGKENVVKIATVGRYGLKSSLDKAKDFYEAKLLSRFPGKTPAEITTDIKELLPEKKDEFGNVIPDEKGDFDTLKQELSKSEMYKQDPELFDAIINKAKNDIFGKTKNTGTHASGICIDNLKNEEQAKGSHMKIGSAKAVGEEGSETDLVKFDMLGLLTLSTIDLTKQNLTQQQLDDLNDFISKIETIDDKDPVGKKVFKAIGNGSSNVFQIDSNGMQRVIKRLKPKTFVDIMAVLALFRPGPMAFIDEYIGRSNGSIPVNFEVQELEEILGDTYGLPVFQEQVMQTFQKLAGFSLGEADLVRRGMAKKGYDLNDYYTKAMAGMNEHGLTNEQAEHVWETLKKFSGYTFNKSHTAAYGYLTMITAYLKEFHKEQYYASLIEAKLFDGINEEKFNEMIEDIKKDGVEVQLDINASHLYKSKVQSNTVIMPLTAASGINENLNSLGDKIFKERQLNGEYKSLEDLQQRLMVETKILSESNFEKLNKYGLFASIGGKKKTNSVSKGMFYKNNEVINKQREVEVQSYETITKKSKAGKPYEVYEITVLDQEVTKKVSLFKSAISENDLKQSVGNKAILSFNDKGFLSTFTKKENSFKQEVKEEVKQEVKEKNEKEPIKENEQEEKIIYSFTATGSKGNPVKFTRLPSGQYVGKSSDTWVIIDLEEKYKKRIIEGSVSNVKIDYELKGTLVGEQIEKSMELKRTEDKLEDSTIYAEEAKNKVGIVLNDKQQKYLLENANYIITEDGKIVGEIKQSTRTGVVVRTEEDGWRFAKVGGQLKDTDIIQVTIGKKSPPKNTNDSDLIKEKEKNKNKFLK